MTPEQWQPLPSEQRASPKPAPNVAAIIGLTAGLLAFLVLPIVLGPVAVVAGVVGNTVALKSTSRGGRMSAAAIVLGLLAVLIFLSRAGAL